MELFGLKRRFNHQALALLVLLCVHNVLYVGAASPANIRDHPYLAVLVSDGHSTCTAILYTTSSLITACHCLVRNSSGIFGPPHELQDPKKIEVYAGDSMETGSHPSHNRIGKVVKVHPKCQSNETAMVYDLGVIEITEPFVLGIWARNILAEKSAITYAINDPYTHFCAELYFDKVGSLVEVPVGLFFNEWCNKTLSAHNLGFDKNTQLCSSRKRDSEVDCGQPDLGGVLQCQDGQRLVGLSTGRNHQYCGKGVPAVYVRLDYAADWIEETFPPTPTTTLVSPISHSRKPERSDDHTHRIRTVVVLTVTPAKGLSPGPYTIPNTPILVTHSSSLKLRGALLARVYSFTTLLIHWYQTC